MTNLNSFINKKLVYTTDECIGCNKCIHVCSVPGACISHVEGDKSRIIVDPNLCVFCGACFDVCDHNARNFYDDTDRFFEDLKAGEPISLFLAPSFRANYPKEYRRILGGLKKLGVKHIYSVAFGADISTWGYLKMITEQGFHGGISQPCPVVVEYIQRYLPELLTKLFPVQSPLMCAATYCRKEMKHTEKFAFISPCIAKKAEIEDPVNEGLVHYNVTFAKLMERVREEDIYGEETDEESLYGLGSLYPIPGGLKNNILWFLGNDVPVREISGESATYRWLHKNKDEILSDDYPFAFIDALNCKNGCLEGTAVELNRNVDHALYEAMKVGTGVQSDDRTVPWGKDLTPKERLDRLNEQFSHLKLSDYIRTYEDKSEGRSFKIPTEDEFDDIFNSMHKISDRSREINCSYCGYDTCRVMATAIYNGANRRENCIHYQKDEALILERTSYMDQLTGSMNRNAYEKYTAESHLIGKPLGILMADINGLKIVNDTQGHKAGDELIQKAARALLYVFDISEVYRIGGDEFVCVIPGIDKAELWEKADRIRKRMKEKNFSMSIGYSYVEKYSGEFDLLTEEADKMMYEDKERYYAESGAKRRV